MKRLCLNDDDTDYFSDLPDDLLDHICSFKPLELQYLTMGDAFRLLERCVRLSCVSRYHYTWLKRSTHHKETIPLLIAVFNDCASGSSLTRLCGLVEKSETLRNGLITLLTNKEDARMRKMLFTPLNDWRDYLHKSHEYSLGFMITYLVKKIDTLSPLPPEVIELLFAFYQAIPTYYPRLVIEEPTQSTCLYQLIVYDDKEVQEEETPVNRQYFITLHSDMVPTSLYQEGKRLDIRLLKPFVLSPPNHINKRVYAFPYFMRADPVLPPQQIAHYMRTSQRLRQALLRCHELLNAKPASKRKISLS